MPEEVVYYVTKFGYLAIFVLVFLQEVGMPNPFPNELLLIFSGYLSFKGLLFLPYIILIVVAADFTGTSILFFLFLTTGTFIIRNKPKWIPLSEKMIDRLSARITKGGKLSIYLFRLTPFTRGYTSVITGLLQVSPKIFLPIALISATTWAVFYVLTGYLIGPHWNFFLERMGSFKYIMLGVLVIVSLIVFFVCFNKRRSKSGTILSLDKQAAT
jgi:membrane protein DedA with SNARE-associated domain